MHSVLGSSPCGRCSACSNSSSLLDFCCSPMPDRQHSEHSVLQPDAGSGAGPESVAGPQRRRHAIKTKSTLAAGEAEPNRASREFWEGSSEVLALQAKKFSPP